MATLKLEFRNLDGKKREFHFTGLDKLPDHIKHQAMLFGLRTTLHNSQLAHGLHSDPEHREHLMRLRWEELKAGKWKSDLPRLR